jgi:hypothetical protein
MDTAGDMAIGALSKHTGTNIETIRYYAWNSYPRDAGSNPLPATK